jgi:hypothetical protein
MVSSVNQKYAEEQTWVGVGELCLDYDDHVPLKLIHSAETKLTYVFYTVGEMVVVDE